MTLLVALVVVVMHATGAGAADPARTPSGANLRQAYPLHTEASATPTPATPRSAARRTGAPASTEEATEMTPFIIILLVVAVCAVAALAIAQRRRRDPALLLWDEDVRPAPMPLLDIFEPNRRFAGASPPDPTMAWTAEIEWSTTDAAPCFVVAGRGERGEDAVVARSEPIAWPPSGAEEVAALEHVVGELAAAMLVAGWTQLEPGEAWYARRFSWTPRVSSREGEAISHG